jgi:hypothetical protein
MISLTTFTARAGHEILLSAGSSYDVLISPSSRLFIHGCNQAGSSFRKINPMAGGDLVSAGTVTVAEQTENPAKYADMKIEFFPNPTTGLLNVNLYNSKNEGEITISVEDVTGKQFGVRKVGTLGGASVNVFDMNQLANGIYIVKIRDQAGYLIRTQKVILQQ